jgi:DNA-binding response OmpR family regulator
MTTHILVADDEPLIRQLLVDILKEHGYEVLTAYDGDHLVRTAQEHVPDLILVDVMMPGVDGYEAIRQLRNDTRTSHVPMLILTARATPTDVVSGFESGADDYITKPFNTPELLARIKGHLRRAAQVPVRSPLTGLPGNVLITEEVKYRLRREEPFAFLYTDLDNFKSFNDTYGPARGDRVIRLLAEVMVDVVRQYGTGEDFMGHIGGDDFAILTTPDAVDMLCTNLIDMFDQRVRGLYDPDDLKRGYLQGVDRQGIPRRFPIISLSIGVVTSENRASTNYEEISRVAADMKTYAKQQPGSSYAVDIRTAHPEAVPDDRRGKRLPTVLLISSDSGLVSMLRGLLEEQGYRVLEAPGILAAHALLAHTSDTSVIVADARLGDSLWELAAVLQANSPVVQLIVLSTRAEDRETSLLHGAHGYVQQPFHAQDFLDAIARTLQPGED